MNSNFTLSMGSGSLKMDGSLEASGKLSGARLVPAAAVPPPPAR